MTPDAVETLIQMASELRPHHLHDTQAVERARAALEFCRRTAERRVHDGDSEAAVALLAIGFAADKLAELLGEPVESGRPC